MLSTVRKKFAICVTSQLHVYYSFSNVKKLSHLGRCILQLGQSFRIIKTSNDPRSVMTWVVRNKSSIQCYAMNQSFFFGGALNKQKKHLQ